MTYAEFRLMNLRQRQLFTIACFNKLHHELSEMELESIVVLYKIIEGITPEKEIWHYSNDYWDGPRKGNSFLRQMQRSSFTMFNGEDGFMLNDWVETAFKAITEQDNLIIAPFCQCFSKTVITQWQPSPALKSWIVGTYDTFKFDASPIIADAMEDESCTNQRALDHLRTSKEHVRGCWVYDLYTGRI